MATLEKEGSTVMVQDEEGVYMDSDAQIAQRTSKKREREPSIEPPVTKSDDGERSNTEHREIRAPAKKNRLDAVDEVDSPPRSPPLDRLLPPSTPFAPVDSPFRSTNEDHPIEGSKLQQIRERVQELNWQDSSIPADDPPTQIGHVRDETMHEADSAPLMLAAPIELHSPARSTQAEDHIPTVHMETQDIPSPIETNAVVDGPHEKTPSDSAQNLPEVPDHIDPHHLTPKSSSIPLPEPVTATPRRRRSSDSDPSDQDAEKSRKRKLMSRESTFTLDGDVPKKPRDNEQAIETPRESNENSLSPGVEANPPPIPQKSTGFAAFSSAASPFATVSGIAVTDPPTTTAAPVKSFQTGFLAFASAKTPFAQAGTRSPLLFGTSSPLTRSESTPSVSPKPNPLTHSPRSRSPSASSLNRRKSPPPSVSRPKPGSAFGTYNNTQKYGFGTATTKRHSPSPSLDSKHSKDTEDDSATVPHSNGVTWGELLVANQDNSDEDGTSKKKIRVEEVDVTTGEENEDTRHQVRARLYQLDDRGSYKERGTGILKINVRKNDGSTARIVMRADGVYRLMLNVALFPGMGCSLAQDPKYVKVSSIENGSTTHYAIKVGSSKAAEELVEKVKHFSNPEGKDQDYV